MHTPYKLVIIIFWKAGWHSFDRHKTLIKNGHVCVSISFNSKHFYKAWWMTFLF